MMPCSSAAWSGSSCALRRSRRTIRQSAAESGCWTSPCEWLVGARSASHGRQRFCFVSPHFELCHLEPCIPSPQLLKSKAGLLHSEFNVCFTLIVSRVRGMFVGCGGHVNQSVWKLPSAHGGGSYSRQTVRSDGTCSERTRQGTKWSSAQLT
jgi:hypothetical protein